MFRPTLLRLVFINCLLMSLFSIAFAQNDSLVTVPPDSAITIQDRFLPRRATMLSAALPGLGQAYVRQYWTIPIIYAGFGVLGYLIYDNNQKYIYWVNRYIAKRTARDNGLPDPYPEEVTYLNRLEVMENAKNTFRRYRDLNIILTGVLYVINIAEANVTAHLKDFDLSDNLALSAEPDFQQPDMGGLSAGISLKLKFK